MHDPDSPLDLEPAEGTMYVRVESYSGDSTTLFKRAFEQDLLPLQTLFLFATKKTYAPKAAGYNVHGEFTMWTDLRVSDEEYGEALEELRLGEFVSSDGLLDSGGEDRYI